MLLKNKGTISLNCQSGKSFLDIGKIIYNKIRVKAYQLNVGVAEIG
jgi:hypothetical protein